MAQGLITFNTKVENGGATYEGNVNAADLNEIKTIVNQNSADAESRLMTLESDAVVGPASATDTALALFDGATGKLIKNSSILVDGSSNVSGIANLDIGTYLTITEGAAPSNPASGFGVIYVKAGDSDLYFKNDAGTETSLTASGSGDVNGPVSSTDNALARFDLTTGKIIQNSLATLDDSGNLSGINNINMGGIAVIAENAEPSTPASGFGVLYVNSSDQSLYFKDEAGVNHNLLTIGSGDVVGPGSATDHAIARFDLATGKLIQNSVGILDDSGNLSGIGNLDMGTYLTITEGAAPSNPASGFGVVYVKSGDSSLYFKNDAGTEYNLTASGAGDVTGPGSATDHALARFDLTTGKIIQNSVGVLDDSGNLSGLNNLDIAGVFTMAEGAAPSNPASGFGVFYVKSADSRPYFKDDAGVEFNLTSALSSTINNPIAEAGTSPTLLSSYFSTPDTTVFYSAGSAVTVNLDTNANQAASTYESVDLIQVGAGVVTVQAAGGVTLNGSVAGSIVFNNQYQAVTLINIGTDDWIAIGDYT